MDQYEMAACADLIDMFIIECNMENALQPGECEILHLAAKELRTIPQNLSGVTSGIACGVITWGLHRVKNRIEAQALHVIRRKIKQAVNEEITIH